MAQPQKIRLNDPPKGLPNFDFFNQLVKSLRLNIDSLFTRFNNLYVSDYFESSQVASTHNLRTNILHPFGKIPKNVWAVLICVTGELGYDAGKEVTFYPTVEVSPTTLSLIVGSQIQIPNLLTTNFPLTNITEANWKIVVRALG